MRTLYGTGITTKTAEDRTQQLVAFYACKGRVLACTQPRGRAGRGTASHVQYNTTLSAHMAKTPVYAAVAVKAFTRHCTR